LSDELKKLNMPVMILQNKFKLTSPQLLFKAVMEIREILKKHEFNIIHSTMAYTHLVMGLSSAFIKCKKVWFQHGPVGGLLDFLASLFPVDIMLFNSNFLMEAHFSSAIIRRGKHASKVIPLPVDMKESSMAKVNSLKYKLNLKDHFAIGSFGRIARGKGYELLILAVSELGMFDTKLFIVGTVTSPADQIYFDELKQLVKNLGIEDVVNFIDHQTDFSVYFKAMDLFVHASTIDEGFGLTVAEAMYSGIPVICSPYGGISDFARDGETARVVKTRETSAVENLKLLILQTREDDIKTKKIAQIAREFILAKYNFSSSYVAITDVYQYLNSIE
jgi:glycosyltransferase involved in cell wall biosynthesis